MTLPFTLLTLWGCDNEAAEALLTCQGGNMEACYRDGMAAAGASRPRFTDARKAFSSACMNSHHALACDELAKLVRDAKGGPKDTARAAELFEIACKGEVKTACVELGLLIYEDQEGFKAEPARAVELFSNACVQVDENVLPPEGPHALAYSCNALGRAYEEGVGVEPPKKDEEKAAELYKKSCMARFAPGCVSAGDLASLSKRKEDIQDAANFYERACKIDAREGCFELASLHEKKAWPGADDVKASEYFQRTCNIDPQRGCYEAGLLMETQRVPAREGEIEYLYNLACEHGNSTACSKRNLQLQK